METLYDANGGRWSTGRPPMAFVLWTWRDLRFDFLNVMDELAPDDTLR
jgi:hypothetical protein